MNFYAGTLVVNKFDILYIYREDKWDSLKWSLRSLQHIDYDNVWVVGDRTPHKVNNIITKKRKDKYRDSNYNFKLGVEAIPQKRVLLMHDDMYLLPGYKPKKYYKGLMSDYPFGGDRAEIFYNTTQWGIDRNYGLHYPMPFINDFEFSFKEPISLMSFLGSLNEFESVESEDCKFLLPKNLEGLPCFSTYNETDALKLLMLRLYPKKSIFE